MKRQIAIQLQPEGSSSCGQHVVAMIVNRPVAEVIDVFGHSHSSVTKELHKALVHYGVETKSTLTRLRGKRLPDFCIVKILFGKNSGHWAIHMHGKLYGSVLGEYTREHLTEHNSTARITSFLDLNLPTDGTI